MSNDIGPGDLVVYVNDKPCRCCGDPVSVRERATYRVVEARWGYNRRTQERILGLILFGVSGSQHHPAWRGHNSTRFRKLNDGEGDADALARIKACKPQLDPINAAIDFLQARQTERNNQIVRQK